MTTSCPPRAATTETRPLVESLSKSSGSRLSGSTRKARNGTTPPPPVSTSPGVAASTVPADVSPVARSTDLQERPLPILLIITSSALVGGGLIGGFAGLAHADVPVMVSSLATAGAGSLLAIVGAVVYRRGTR